MLVLFKTIITAAMLTIGSFLLINQQLNIGQFIAAEIVIITVINAVEKLINNLDSVYDVLTSVEKISAITDMPAEYSGSLMVKKEEAGYEIELSNITFGYNKEKSIIRELTVKIEPGEKVCIMGAEGSGKSTLLKLMTGAYTDYEGNILVNKIPIKNYDTASLRANTGIFLSQQDIFQGSLEENITMGNEEIDRSEVIYLFEKAGLTGFLATLKDGFDTVLDPTGDRLPRNVVNKLLLVRALVNKPRLILLEDPFSGLEETFKTQIKNLLLDKKNPATVVISTNDAQFASQCDKIIRV
jgi:ABC-type bacteriocin/lantibiotic exporter with double-glycine peptidase domain